jgi:putative phage-type endonuclease
MKLVTLDQRTPEWLQWRQSGLGGSDAPAIVGVSPWRTPLQLWQQKTGQREKQAENSAMSRGRRLESTVQGLYEALLGYRIEPICCCHDDHSWLKASLDGWNAQRQIAVEIKAPNKLDHQSALDGKIPEKYIPQCDHILMVTGARLLHYVSYSNYFPARKQLVILSRYPNPTQLEALYQAELEFWTCVLDRIPPGEE